METNMIFRYNDGGRKEAGYKGETRDCVTRVIAIAAELPYQKVYDDINRLCAGTKSHARKGVSAKIARAYIESLGWKWHACMSIGSGCTTHLVATDLPNGRLIVRLSRHYAAVIDGVLHDNHDCSREGTRCVYGYFMKP